MTIIAAVDRSAQAPGIIAEATRLAEAFDDELHAVHVLSQSDFVELERTNVEETGQAIEMDRVKDIASEIAAEAATETDQPLESVGLVGKAADEIVRYAGEQDTRYIVLGGRKRSPVGKAVFGSVTQSVLLNSDHPVVTIMAEE